MRLKCDEANKFIVGQPLDSFEDDAIFHTDHIIDIMNLCQMYQLEFDRKFSIVDHLFNCKLLVNVDYHDLSLIVAPYLDDERVTPITSNAYFTMLENISIDWSDGSKNSIVDADQGEFPA